MISQSLQFILPEMILLAFAGFAFMAGAFQRSKNFVGIFSFLAVTAGVLLLPTSFKAGEFFFSNMLVNDGLSVFFRTVILLISGLVILISIGYKQLEEDVGEFFFFLLAVTVSMMLAVSSNNLMMIYITLETISILSYIMAGYLKRDVFARRGGV